MEYQEYPMSVWDRLVVAEVLPAAGDLTTVRIVRHLQEELSFDEDEHKLLNFQQPVPGQLRWTEGVVDPKPVGIGAKGHSVIRAGLEQLVKNYSANGQLTILHLDLAERFGVDLEALDEEMNAAETDAALDAQAVG